MDTNATGILNPIVQYGFAGMCGVLLAILVWLIAKLMALLEKTNSIVEANTNAINALVGKVDMNIQISVECKDRLLSRPCIAKKE